MQEGSPNRTSLVLTLFGVNEWRNVSPGADAACTFFPRGVGLTGPLVPSRDPVGSSRCDPPTRGNPLLTTALLLRRNRGVSGLPGLP